MDFILNSIESVAPIPSIYYNVVSKKPLKLVSAKPVHDNFVYWPDGRLAGPVNDIVKYITSLGLKKVYTGIIYLLSDGKVGDWGYFPVTPKLILDNSFNPADKKSDSYRNTFIFGGYTLSPENEARYILKYSEITTPENLHKKQEYNELIKKYEKLDLSYTDLTKRYGNMLNNVSKLSGKNFNLWRKYKKSVVHHISKLRNCNDIILNELIGDNTLEEFTDIFGLTLQQELFGYFKTNFSKELIIEITHSGFSDPIFHVFCNDITNDDIKKLFINLYIPFVVVNNFDETMYDLLPRSSIDVSTFVNFDDKEHAIDFMLGMYRVKYIFSDHVYAIAKNLILDEYI